MLTDTVSALQLFRHNLGVLRAVTAGFDREHWRLIDAQGHSPRWIVAHLAASRLRLCGYCGKPQGEPTWLGAAGRGGSVEQLPEAVEGSELLESCARSQLALEDVLPQLPENIRSSPLGRTLPDGSTTIGGAVAFLAWHEAYHLGQLGLLRRQAGFKGLA